MYLLFFIYVLVCVCACSGFCVLQASKSLGWSGCPSCGIIKGLLHMDAARALSPWMSVVLKLPKSLPFNTCSYAVVTPQIIELFLLLLINCNFAQVRNCNVNVEDLVFGTHGNGSFAPSKFSPPNG